MADQDYRIDSESMGQCQTPLTTAPRHNASWRIFPSAVLASRQDSSAPGLASPFAH